MPRFSKLFLAAAAVLTVSSGIAAAADAPASALYNTLISSGNARDRALGALMTVPGNDDDRNVQQSTLTFAAAGDPNDTMVLWLAANAVTGCQKAPESRATLNMLRQAEPLNAAGTLLELNRAAACGDQGGVALALGRMSQGKQFDTHYGDTLQAWLVILAREPTAQPLLKANKNSGPLRLAATLASASAEPSFTPLLDACRSNSDAARATACGQAGRVLAYSSKTALDRSIGFSLLQNANALTASDNAAMRELHWLMTPPSSPTARAAMSRAIAAGWHEDKDELMILRGAYTAAGLPLSPPPNWVDPALARSRK